MTNNINTKLSLLYDDDFNAKYNYSNRLNKEISLKDKIIDIHYDQSHKYRRNIKILKSILLMAGLLVFMALLIGVRIFDKKFGTSLMIVIVVAFVIKILILRYSKKSDFNKENKLTTKYFTNTTQNTPKCPRKCKPKPNPNIKPKRIKEKVLNNLKTDSSLNVWLYGDQPEALYYNPRMYGNKYPDHRVTEEETTDSPQPWFNQITDNTDQEEPVQGVTYYDCVKELSPKGTKAEFRTAIPCQYYPGYKTLQRCIIDENNNCNIV